MSHRIFAALATALLAFFLAGCSSDSPRTEETAGPGQAHQGRTANPAYCAQNHDPACPDGSFAGPFVALTTPGGHWNADGNPVNGGPVGADGSTGNNLTQEYCARNEDPACPMGSYVAPDAIKNPDGSHSYVVCEGTICTNPNHGAGGPPGHWNADGNPVNGGPVGADGSIGNDLTHEYCARNEDPGCPVGSFVAPDAIPSPDGTNGFVPCEGTICTNPNYGGGDAPAADTPGDDGAGPPDLEGTGQPDSDPGDVNDGS